MIRCDYSLKDLFLAGKERLASVPTPDLDAKCLLLYTASLSESQFYASPDSSVAPPIVRRFFRLIARRRQGIPIAYILGEKEFWSLSFRVGKGVLVPRPETELLVEKALDLLPSVGGTAVDIGTGCGCVALSLAQERRDLNIIATDASRRALSYARRNAGLLGLSHVEFLQGSLLKPLGKKGLYRDCDMILSNPPYIRKEEWPSLPAGIRKYEPRKALIAGKKGTEFHSRLVVSSPEFLKPGGYLLVEIGEGQRDAVLSLFGTLWHTPVCWPDLNGLPRIVSARKI